MSPPERFWPPPLVGDAGAGIANGTAGYGSAWPAGDRGGTVPVMSVFALLVCLATGGLGAAVGGLTAAAVDRAPRPATVSRSRCGAVTALMWTLTCLRWAVGALPAWWLPVPLVATALAVPLTAADLAHHRLPDALTIPAYPATALAVLLAAGTGPGVELAGTAVAGAAVFGGAHALVRAVSPAWLGAGDVKLSGSLGGLLGAVGWPALPTAACVAVAGTAVPAVVAGLRSSRAGVPHGPGLLTATCLVVLFPGSALAGP